MNWRQRRAVRYSVPAVCVLIGLCGRPGLAADEHPLLPIMQSELQLSMEKLVGPDGTKSYFIQYAVTDEDEVNVAATLGALTQNTVTHVRYLDVDVRCGDYALDSTRQIRGGYYGGREYGGGGAALPLDDNPLATRHSLWLATDTKFKAAMRRLAQVKANLKVKVEEEDPSDDFSREEPSTHIGPWLTYKVDRDQLAQRVKKLSERFRTHPQIYSSSVTLSGEAVSKGWPTQWMSYLPDAINKNLDLN